MLVRMPDDAGRGVTIIWGNHQVVLTETEAIGLRGRFDRGAGPGVVLYDRMTRALDAAQGSRTVNLTDEHIRATRDELAKEVLLGINAEADDRGMSDGLDAVVTMLSKPPSAPGRPG
jgi:hypothetical protein